jgi:hypothetical protein
MNERTCIVFMKNIAKYEKLKCCATSVSSVVSLADFIINCNFSDLILKERSLTCLHVRVTYQSESCVKIWKITIDDTNSWCPSF